MPICYETKNWSGGIIKDSVAVAANGQAKDHSLVSRERFGSHATLSLILLRQEHDPPAALKSYSQVAGPAIRFPLTQTKLAES